MSEHAHEVGGPFLHTYLELVGDPAHWAFEVTTSGVETLVIALILTPLIRRWVTRHDRTVHTPPAPDYLEEYGGRWGALFAYEDADARADCEDAMGGDGEDDPATTTIGSS